MNDIYLSFPEKLLSVRKVSETKKTNQSKEDKELFYQRLINTELLRICRQQKRLIDEQSAMIVEILEEMGR